MLKEKAFAKVNLHLQVTGKRKDGYHTLQTIFAKISIHDTVYIEAIREPKVELSVRGQFHTPTGPKNIAFKAAQWYLKRYGIKNWGVKIIVEKNIPPGSGLGGGSSDAAAVIRAMVRFFGEKDPQLVEASSTIGADVPFFVSDVSVAYAEGIGEKIEPIKVDLSHLPLHLWIGDFPISTKEIFDLFDSFRDEVLSKKPPLPKARLIECTKDANPEAFRSTFFNHLEEPVFSRYPKIADVKKTLQQLGAFCLMSGSGSTVYTVGEIKDKGDLELCRVNFV